MKNKNFQYFFVEGPLPTMNEIILASSTHFKGGIRFGSRYTALKKKWNKKICEAIEVHEIKPIERFSCEFVWVEKNKRKDPDNIASAVKFIFDAMVTSKIIPNDTWNYNLGWTNQFVVGKLPGVTVILSQD